MKAVLSDKLRRVLQDSHARKKLQDLLVMSEEERRQKPLTTNGHTYRVVLRGPSFTKS